MLREQLSQQLESNEDKNGAQLKVPSSTYGSISSSMAPLLQENLHANSNSNGMGQGYPLDDDDDDDGGGISDSSDEDHEDDDEDDELSYDDSSDEEQALYRDRQKKGAFALQCEKMDPVLNPILKLYRLVKDAVILVTNTDDVWDSPAFENDHGYPQRPRGGSIHSYSSESVMLRRQRIGQQRAAQEIPSLSVEKRVTFRHKLGVLFWFLVLAIFYALERCSFKVMVDRMGPFRMVVGGEVVVAVHALITGTWIGLRWLCKKSKRNTTMLPLHICLFMAMLDTVQLLLVVISGSHVPPTLTAIIVHVTIPLTTFINHLTGPNGLLHGVFGDARKPPRHEEELGAELIETDPNQKPQLYFGSTLIMLSSFLAISPAILTLFTPSLLLSQDAMADRIAWNILLFFLSHFPGAISQAYKEHTLASYAQPVDPDLLNTLLSIFSAIFAFLISPIFYPLQGFADTPSTPDDKMATKLENWIHQYPSKGVNLNFKQGLECFAGTLSDEVQIRGYSEQAHCDFAYGFVLLHVFSIIVISHAVGKICNAGAFKIMHKGISAGIILSVVTLFFYQVFVDDVEYGVLPSVYHISCAAVLVAGSEVYHRVTLEIPSFETEYPPAVIYDEDQ